MISEIWQLLIWILCGGFFGCVQSNASVTIATARYDNTRNGVNISETVITPANVASMASLGSYTLDGAVFTQPLYIPSLTVNGVSHNVLIVATMNNTAYALNADTPGSSPLWSTNFGATLHSLYAVTYGFNIGIYSTPVADVTNGFLYLVSANASAVWTLRKIALATGVQTSSVDIAGSNGGITFAGNIVTQHTPLAFANGNVYAGFGAGNEPFTWYGWMFAYNASSLSQVAVLNLAPAIGAGAWEANGGPAVDGSGNLYIVTGNGDWDGTTNFSQSVVKLSPTLSILDWFTPSNESATSAVDADVASGTVMLIPNTTLLTFGSKDGRAWVIDTTNMGHLQGTGAAPQVFTVASITPGGGTGVYGGCFFGSTGYFPMAGLQTFAFLFSGSTYNTTAVASTVASFGQVAMSGSSNNGSNPILWMLTVVANPVTTKRPVTLRAMNPATLTEYWNSGALGNAAKFVMPVVANGKVYVASVDGTVTAFAPAQTVFGSGMRGVTTLRGVAVLR